MAKNNTLEKKSSSFTTKVCGYVQPRTVEI